HPLSPSVPPRRSSVLLQHSGGLGPQGAVAEDLQRPKAEEVVAEAILQPKLDRRLQELDGEHEGDPEGQLPGLGQALEEPESPSADRKSTRLNSSHVKI